MKPASSSFLFVIICLLTAGPAAGEQHEHQRRPHAKVGTVGLGDVQWTGGFWKDRFDNCRDKMIPAMWELMKGTEYKPFFEHFRIAAGLSEGRHRGAKWNDGDFYKLMEAVSATLAVTHDPVWEKRLDEIIEVLGKAQRADGYLHTPVLIAARNGDPEAKLFGDRLNFEMYNMGHLLTAACRREKGVSVGKKGSGQII